MGTLTVFRHTKNKVFPAKICSLQFTYHLKRNIFTFYFHHNKAISIYCLLVIVLNVIEAIFLMTLYIYFYRCVKKIGTIFHLNLNFFNLCYIEYHFNLGMFI